MLDISSGEFVIKSQEIIKSLSVGFMDLMTPRKYFLIPDFLTTSNMMIPPIDYRLRSWNSHTEDMISDKYLLLEIAECVYTCRIACEDHDISSAIMKSMDSGEGEWPYLISTQVAIWGIGPIHLEDHLDLWEFFLELSHHDLSTESRVKKSDTHWKYIIYKYNRLYEKYKK